MLPRPLHNNIIVEPADQIKEMEKNGIKLPEYYQNIFPYKGTVVSVGPEVRDILPGDVVIFDRLRVDNLKDRGCVIKNGRYLLVFPDNLVWAILL